MIIEKEDIRNTFPFVDNITVCGRTEEEHNKNERKFETIASMVSHLMRANMYHVQIKSHCLGIWWNTTLLNLTQSV